MKTYPSKQAKDNFGSVLEDAQRQPVQLTKNGRPIGGIVNQEMFEKVLEYSQEVAQKEIFKIFKKIQAESSGKPKPTREELRYLLECDDDEINALFGEDFFEK